MQKVQCAEMLKLANPCCHLALIIYLPAANMYLTSLPDHNQPGFDEQAHFDRFGKHNIIFNALSHQSYCDNHVGCLSFKTVLTGEEWYGVHSHQLAIRPGQFLILNDDQGYSCRIHKGEAVRTLSVFFKREFAASVFQDAQAKEINSLDNPFSANGTSPEFFQTITVISRELQFQLSRLISSLENSGYDSNRVDEHLVFLLHHLLNTLHSELLRAKRVNAVKVTTRKEIYKRLCTAKDVLHSSYMNKPDLNFISEAACLSVPQLVRQFKSVFHTTPHQYLSEIRLKRAAELLKLTDKPVSEIAWDCGFENVSAFCRAFRLTHGIQPNGLRKKKQ
jgi:AraC family transcriptional regulator